MSVIIILTFASITPVVFFFIRVTMYKKVHQNLLVALLHPDPLGELTGMFLQ